MINFLNIKSNSKILDPTCGCGVFLVTVYNYLKQVNKNAMENIYGVDLMEDNIVTVKRRLTEIFLNKGMSIKEINFNLDRNIICEDALTYHYEFHTWVDPDKLFF